MKLNLSKKIALMVATIILVISLGLGITALRISSNTVKNQVEAALFQLAEEGAEHIEAIMTIHLNSIIELANRQGTQTMNWYIQYESLNEDLERLGFLDMAVVTPNRLARYIKRGETLNLTHKDYIEKAFQGEANVSDVMVNSANKDILVYAAPIMSNNRVVGVLIGERETTALNETINKMGFGENGFAYLIGSDGSFNAHHDTSHLTNNKNIFEDIEYKDLVVKLNELGIGNKGVIDYELSGLRRYIGIAPVKNTGWILGVGALEEDVLGPLKFLRNSIILGSTGFLVLGIIAASLLARSISKPIVDLSLIIEDFSNYDLSIEEDNRIYEYSNRTDEIGNISKALLIMDRNLVDLVTEISNGAQSVASSSEELTATSQQSAIAAEEVARAIDEIANGANDQSMDTEKGAMEVENLGRKIEKNQEDLRELDEASEEIFKLKDEGLEIVKELVENTKASDKGALEISNVINNVDESANKIEVVSQMIQSIAEQTNLLALNAAIEAARAGEAGRGFAVVSEEIRKLAEQTNSFTGEITQIIEDLKARTENAVNTMEEIKVTVASQSESVKLTNIKFEGINEAIERIRGLIHKISRSGEEMEKEKDLIIDIMQNLSAISQENAASTEEASASVEEQTAAMEEIANASEALAGLADHMQQLVAKFKL